MTFTVNIRTRHGNYSDDRVTELGEIVASNMDTLASQSPYGIPAAGLSEDHAVRMAWELDTTGTTTLGWVTFTLSAWSWGWNFPGALPNMTDDVNLSGTFRDAMTSLSEEIDGWDAASEHDDEAHRGLWSAERAEGCEACELDVIRACIAAHLRDDAPHPFSARSDVPNLAYWVEPFTGRVCLDRDDDSRLIPYVCETCSGDPDDGRACPATRGGQHVRMTA